MRSPGINGEAELRGQPANPGSPGKTAIKTECVWVCIETKDDWRQLELQVVQNYNQIITTNKPTFYRPDTLPVTQPTASEHWRKDIWSEVK